MTPSLAAQNRTAPDAQRTIVAGVDGSPGGQAALRWPLAEAKFRCARVEAVHAWLVPFIDAVPQPSVIGLRPYGVEADPSPLLAGLEQEAAELFAASLADVADEPNASVEVESKAVEGRPAVVLLEAAAGTDLLAVGTRGHGGFRGRLLGSVSQQCVLLRALPGRGRARAVRGGVRQRAARQSGLKIMK
jgi:nucleotide-binding universal stress UspA family protein